jgi:hypothetical protein
MAGTKVMDVLHFLKKLLAALVGLPAEFISAPKRNYSET